MFKCHTVLFKDLLLLFFSLLRRNIYIQSFCACQCLGWNADKNPWCFSFQTQHLPFWIPEHELCLSAEVCAMVLCHVRDSIEACNHGASLWTVLLALHLHLLRYGDCGLVLLNSLRQPQHMVTGLVYLPLVLQRMCHLLALRFRASSQPFPFGLICHYASLHIRKGVKFRHMSSCCLLAIWKQANILIYKFISTLWIAIGMFWEGCRKTRINLCANVRLILRWITWNNSFKTHSFHFQILKVYNSL